MPLPDLRPFGLGLLDAILAKIALAGGDQRFDLVCGAALGDGDEGDVRRFAARNLAGRADSVANNS